MKPRSFPATISPSKLKDFKQCSKLFEYKYVIKRLAVGKAVDLVAGGAFAKGLEVARRQFFEHGRSHDDAIAIGLGYLMAAYGNQEDISDWEKKPFLRVASAYEAYFERFDMRADPVRPHLFEGKYGIEFNFAIPLDVKHPETGDPIILRGRADMIGELGKGLYIVDEKSTLYLGDKWSSKWDLDGQFACYSWAAQQWGFDVRGAIIRGIAFRKAGNADFAEAIIPIEPWKVERWYEQTIRDIERAIQAWKEGYFGYALGYPCERCEYQDICRIGKESDRMSWLTSSAYRDYEEDRKADSIMLTEMVT